MKDNKNKNQHQIETTMKYKLSTVQDFLNFGQDKYGCVKYDFSLDCIKDADDSVLRDFVELTPFQYCALYNSKVPSPEEIEAITQLKAILGKIGSHQKECEMPIWTYIQERIADIEDKHKFIKDPDYSGSSHSKMLQKVLDELYPNEISTLCKNKGKILTDTMNSLNTTFNQITEEFREKDEIKTFDKDNGITNKKSFNKAIFYAAHQGVTNYYYAHLREYTNLERFMATYHAIGNFLPVPYRFNSGRKAKTEDYIDLTLAYIYCFYNKPKEIANNHEKKQEFNEDAIKLLLSINENTFKLMLTVNEDENQTKPESNARKMLKLKKQSFDATIAWLKKFENWNGFIEANFLQCYVDGGVNQDGSVKFSDFEKPMPLWEDHFTIKENEGGYYVECKNNLPQGDEINQFLTNASERIEFRGKQMVAELKEINGNGGK